MFSGGLCLMCCHFYGRGLSGQWSEYGQWMRGRDFRAWFICVVCRYSIGVVCKQIVFV